MGTIVNFLGKLVNKAIYHYSFEGKEIRRIRKIPRYHKGHTNILGFDFIFVDSASFIGQYVTILKKPVYNFEADNDKPYIIDCGANIGVSIVYFKEKYPKSKIIAFEPDKNIFSVLKENIDKRGYDNITLINKGLWNHEGKIKFTSDGADGGKILHFNNAFPDRETDSEIETTSLRAYLDRKVDFLKIDIEGAESVVMEDCQNLLQDVQHIFIEYHSTVNELQQLDSILNILTRNNFRYYIESTGIKNELPFIRRDISSNFDNFLNIYAYK